MCYIFSVMDTAETQQTWEERFQKSALVFESDVRPTLAVRLEV